MTTPENYADGYTAVLKDVQIAKWYYSDDEVAQGYIYNDRRGRFPDGQFVTTSVVMATAKVNGVEYIITKNSIYKVEGEIT